MPHGKESPGKEDLPLFRGNDLVTRKSAIRVTELQNQASISRHPPRGELQYLFSSWRVGT